MPDGPRYTSDPDAPWCKSCGGTGIRYDVPVRIQQALKLRFTVEGWIDPVTGRHKQRGVLGVSPSAGPDLTYPTYNPFIDWLRRVEHLQGIGGVMPLWVEPLIDGSFMCMGCHGTGRYRLERAGT